MLTLIRPVAFIDGRHFWHLSSVPVTRKGRRSVSLKGAL